MLLSRYLIALRKPASRILNTGKKSISEPYLVVIATFPGSSAVTLSICANSRLLSNRRRPTQPRASREHSDATKRPSPSVLGSGSLVFRMIPKDYTLVRV
jgi:hypothetical protein